MIYNLLAFDIILGSLLMRTCVPTVHPGRLILDRDLVVAVLLTRGEHNWIPARVELLFPDVAHLIYKIKPSSFDAKDAFCWQKSRNSIYPVKIGYYAALEASGRSAPPIPVQENFSWKGHVWSISTSEKTKDVYLEAL